MDSLPDLGCSRCTRIWQNLQIFQRLGWGEGAPSSKSPGSYANYIWMFSLQVQDKRKSGGQTYALKALVKQHIVETKQQEHVYNEKKILMELDSPFIIRYLSI